ncbi:CHASE3 domain-containing protein [Grimontia marina]|uniref:Methyl-accepting chemotaxis protein I n=1 Tax=Grimontia marina TaxID=646534 RepID=A0A128F199_9GAMM|nr:CHASE3 domain-containing protein [Grimontia marina]CZF80582.1 Methyl-accepting chemotaxis protein I [Grimontia marina]
MLENLSLRAKIFLGNGVVLLFLIALGLLSLNSMKNLSATERWVEHTHEVINKAQNLIAAAINMETGMRGYLLAGKEQFLEPYDEGKREFESIVEDLKQKVSDNPRQVSLLQDVEVTIADWQRNVTEDMISLRRSIGNAKTMNDMSVTVGEAKGKAYIDKARGLLDTFIAQQRSISNDNFPASQSDEDREGFSDIAQKALLIKIAVLDMETGMRGFLLTGQEAFLEPYAQGSNQISRLLTGLKLEVRDNPIQVSVLENIEDVLGDWRGNVAENYITLRREIGDAKTMDDISDLVAQERGKQYFDKFRSQMRTFIEREDTLMAARTQAAHESVTSTYITIIAGMVFAVIASVLVANFLSAAIMRPFQDIFKGLTVFSSKELGDLRVSFNEVVRRMNTGASRVAMIAANIEDVSQNLSQISNRQASSVEETSASAEEISSMVQNNVQSAEHSRDLSKEVGNRMTDLDEAMCQISESNHKITELVKIIAEIGAKTEIIDEIVFQTKLLSFNASVEAERAGEHGRGFAVVAQEVGNLAQMSGKAATDISAIVKQSISEAETIAKENTIRVENGGGIVSETRQQAQSMVEGATNIFEASNEQARGIQEISNAVESINRATQHAASIADQASNSSSELTRQAEDLNKLVLHMSNFLCGHEAEAKEENKVEKPLNWEESIEHDFERNNHVQKANAQSDDVTMEGNNNSAWNRL